ncbi:6-phosphogluconolactonase [Agromyces archimandritae]|uniref:6-phosphogluconolactonase n=1 Tax=Agromyces archimandritae TaxID=2781962 RepID=A0A975INI9_9MICO|nr:6-phosphogluconolactonase [Agromyces archimandritae]QTX04658.1 6-phosphogluconolactonase [Agromyces archimandritae]
MSADRRVVVRADKAALAEEVAARFLRVLASGDGPVHVALTGGSMGAAVLAAAADRPEAGEVDWGRVHFWWGDERWLPAGDDERNDAQADAALLDRVDAGGIHRFPSTDSGLGLDEAAAAYTAELAAFGDAEHPYPAFDIAFLGVGPDGHIASLFPHRLEIRVEDRPVVAVRDSPKPPPERLSLTLPVLNASERVWLVLAGADKAWALGAALSGSDETPAASVFGRAETVFFADAAASTEVPEGIIADD